MSEMLLAVLRNKLDALGATPGIDAETRRNALKEELQFYVLNFIYHHPEYRTWIMYGGSALRICHGLDRMSVDLDFEVSAAVTEPFLTKLKQEIEEHFTASYGAGPDFLSLRVVNGRGLVLKFHVTEELAAGNPSSQVHVKIDLNRFVAPTAVTARIPINRDQLSFVITTYNMSALMASKVAAIFLRGSRGVGPATYEEKGRDIYDLLWYMGKKIVPDLEYLAAKHVGFADPRALFDRLTVQMGKVSDSNLRQDLLPLFVNRTHIEHWLENWRETYFHLLDAYQIHTVTDLVRVTVYQDVMRDIFSFTFHYATDEDPAARVQITYPLSEYWLEDSGLPPKGDKKVGRLIELTSNGSTSHPASEDAIKRYATLFAKKNSEYFDKTHSVVTGNKLKTKFIRMTAENLNQNEEIVLNRSALLSCTLDDLLK